jgi:class 3 adenylate cyclase
MVHFLGEQNAGSITSWDNILKVAAAALAFATALAGTAVALAKYFSSQSRSIDALRREIKDLTVQTKILKQPIEVGDVSLPNLFQKLLSVSTEARDALGADLHSISVPVPPADPTHLRIILSSDVEPEKVVGREIPITQGIAAWVFRRKEASFKNPGGVDPRYFNLVDKAAGTKTGEGAILSVPLVTGGICQGVIQFMKSGSGRFAESDVQVASRAVPAITRILAELQSSTTADIPSVAHGDVKRATILFTDITAYTDIAGKLRLSDTVGLLNEYYSRLVQIAITHNGKLEEYLGDGLYFSFLQEAAGHAAQLAVIAAFEMQSEYRKILDGWIDFQHPVSNKNTHRIGIASGDIYTGFVGHPQQRRSKLIGPAVDFAAHLCEDTKPLGGGIAASQLTKELIGDGWPQFKRRTLAHGPAWFANDSKTASARTTI